MKYSIIYFSRFGHGKQIIHKLSEILTEKEHDVKILSTNEAKPDNIPEADLYVFSAPSEMFRLNKDMRVFIKGITSLDGKKFATINTHAMKNRNQLKNMEKLLEAKGMTKVAEVDFYMKKDINDETGINFSDGWEEILEKFAKKIQ